MSDVAAVRDTTSSPTSLVFSIIFSIILLMRQLVQEFAEFVGGGIGKFMQVKVK